MALVAKHKQEVFNENFIGRLKYIGDFNAVLNNPKKFNILMYHGLGGIGKTTLLKQLSKKTKKSNNISIFINLETYNTPEDFYQQLRIELSRHKIKSTYFDLAFFLYLRKKNPHVVLTKQNIAFFEEGSVVADVIGELGGSASGLPIIPGLINIANKYIPKIKLRLSDKNNIRPELEELDDLEADEIKNLFQKFLDYDIREYREKSDNKIIFFLDTYETLYRNLNYTQHSKSDEWIRQLILSLDNTDSIFVIAGRDKLSWIEQDKDWDEYLYHFELSGLSDDESEQLLIKSGIDNELIRTEIVKNSNNFPFYLEQSVRLFRNMKNPKIEDFKNIDSKETFKKFLQYSDQYETILLKHLSAARYFTKETFAALIKEFNLVNIALEDFCIKFSIEVENNIYRMHKLMQNSLIDNTNKDTLKNIYQYFLKYYKDEFEKELNNPSKKLISIFKEELYHKSKIDESNFINWFTNKLEVIKMIGYTSQIPIIIYEAISLYEIFASDLLLELSLFYTENKQFDNANNILFYELGEANINKNQRSLFYYIKGMLENNNKVSRLDFKRSIRLCKSTDLLVKLNYETKHYENVTRIIYKERVSNIIASDYYCKIANKNPNLNLNDRLKILNIATKKLDKYPYAYVKKANIYYQTAESYFSAEDYDKAINSIDESLKYYNKASDVNKEYLHDLYNLLAKVLKDGDMIYNRRLFPTNSNINMVYLSIIKLLLPRQEDVEKYIKFVDLNICEQDYIFMHYAIAKFFFERNNYDKAKEIFINMKQNKTIDERVLIKIIIKLIIITIDEKELNVYLLELTNLLKDNKLLSSSYKKIYFSLINKNERKRSISFLDKDISLQKKLYRSNQNKYYKELLIAYNNAIKCYKTIHYTNYGDYSNTEIIYKYIEQYINIATEHADNNKILIGYDIYFKFSVEINNIKKIEDNELEIVNKLQSNKFNPIIDRLYIEIIKIYDKKNNNKKLEEYYIKQLKEREKNGCDLYNLSRTYFYISIFFINKVDNKELAKKYLRSAIDKKEHYNYAETLKQYLELIKLYNNEKVTELLTEVFQYAKDYKLKEIATYIYINFLINMLFVIEDNTCIIVELNNIDDNIIENNLDRNERHNYFKVFTINKNSLNPKIILPYFEKQYIIIDQSLNESDKYFLKKYGSIIRFYSGFANFIFDNNITNLDSEKYILKIKDLILKHMDYEEIRKECGYVNSYYMYRLSDFGKTLSSSLINMEIKCLINAKNIEDLRKIYKYLQDNYLETKDYQKAIDFFIKTDELYENSTDQSLVNKSNFYYNKIYKSLDENSDKIRYMLKIINMNLKFEHINDNLLSSYYKEIYELYYQSEKYSNSEKYFKKSISLYNNSLATDLKGILKLYERIYISGSISVYEKIKYLNRIIRIKEYLKFLTNNQRKNYYEEIIDISYNVNNILASRYINKLKILNKLILNI